MISPLRIVLTGSESVGKTTLAADLGAHYGVPVVPEFVRGYAQRIARPITYDDLLTIATEQAAMQDARLAEAIATGRGLVVHDTDPLSTLAYAQHYFGGAPDAVEQLVRARRAHHYLLLDIDVPWVPDGIRDRGDRREEMQHLFHDTLARVEAPYSIIQGTWPTRRALAIAHIDALLREHISNAN
jgi:nicotinamide riboside kinase